MNNYWALSEFGITAINLSKEQYDELEISISSVGDFIRKCINKSANFEVSVMCDLDKHASFHMISGICQFGIYDEDTQQINQQIDGISIKKFNNFIKVIKDLYQEVVENQKQIKTRQPRKEDKDILAAWGNLDRSKGISTDPEHITQYSDKGYTTKDVHPYQKDMLMLYDEYYLNDNEIDSFEKDMQEVTKRTNIDNLETHIKILSGKGFKILNEIEMTK